MFHLEFTRDLETLLADHQTWNELARGVPFRETSWLGPWWQTFGPDHEPFVLVARDDEKRIRGILPLYRELGDRVLSMIGDGEACSDHVSVLARPEDVAEVGKQMGVHLAMISGDVGEGWDVIDIDGVVEGDLGMTALMWGLNQAGASLHAHSRLHVWDRAAVGSWDEHLMSHGKSQRRSMRKWQQKLESLDKQVARCDCEVDPILDAMIDMHQRRWNQAGKSGSFASPRFRQFIRKSSKDFARRGRLYLTGLVKDDTFIGSELKFVGGDRVLYSYSSGYDVDHAELEPGRLMCVDGLMELYRSDLTGLDFMRGDECYKERFANRSRRLFRVRVVAPNWLPQLRHAAWCTQFELKQWFRRHSGRPLIDVSHPAEFFAAGTQA